MKEKMKKTYMKPQIEAIEMKYKQILMGSAHSDGLDDITKEEYDPSDPIDW